VEAGTDTTLASKHAIVMAACFCKGYAEDGDRRASRSRIHFKSLWALKKRRSLRGVADTEPVCSCIQTAQVVPIPHSRAPTALRDN